jgi:hypothetical protein
MTAIGYEAGNSNTGSAQLVAVGYQTLKNATDENCGIGSGAGLANTSGYFNTYVGKDSGSNKTTGVYCTYIGAFGVTGSSTTVNSEMVIAAGYNGGSTTGKGADTGFINAGGGGNYAGNNSSSWLTTSDRRLKKNIVDNNQGLEIINQIRVRNFEYRLPEEITELNPAYVINIPGVKLGPIAQELQEVCPDCVTEESTGVLSVDSDEIFWHMVNAIKDLKAINDAQANRIEILEAQNATFEVRLAALEAE